MSMVLQTSLPQVEGIVGIKPAELEKEYVASGGNGYLDDYAEALPPYISDIDRDFGVDVWRRMRKDPQIESSLSLLIMACQAQGIQITPGITSKDLEDKDHTWLVKLDQADVDIASSACAFVNYCINHLESSFTQVIYEMGLGLAYGHKVAEQIYRKDTVDPEVGLQVLLVDIKPKPQTSISFVVDAFRRLLGIMYSRPNGLPADISIIQASYYFQLNRKKNGLSQIPKGVIDPRTGSQKLDNTITDYPAEQSYIPIIPPEKFAIFTFKKENGDPRGNSILESSYHPYYAKGRIWFAYLGYLMTMAHPAIWGTTPEGALSAFETDDEGNRIETKSPEQELEGRLEKVQNGAVIGAPGGTKFGILQAQGEGRAFLEGLGACDHQIVRGILYQSLAVEEGKYMARAASETHQDILGILIRFIKSLLADMIYQQIIVPLVRYNYGDRAVKRGLAPKVSLGQTEHQDFKNDADAIAHLEQVGYLHWSQRPGLDRMIGLPDRDMKAQMAEIQAIQAALSQPPPGATAPGDQSTKKDSGPSSGPQGGGTGLDVARRGQLDVSKREGLKVAGSL